MNQTQPSTQTQTQTQTQTNQTQLQLIHNSLSLTLAKPCLAHKDIVLTLLGWTHRLSGPAFSGTYSYFTLSDSYSQVQEKRAGWLQLDWVWLVWVWV